jgi:hypothetical protein
LKNSRTHPQRLSRNNPWAGRRHWDQLWSLPGNLNRKFEHVSYCSITTTHLPMHPWKPQSLRLTTWLSFPFLPTRRTYPPVISLFPKLKMKLKLSQHFFFGLIREVSDRLRIVLAQGNTYTELCVKHYTSSYQ